MKSMIMLLMAALLSLTCYAQKVTSEKVPVAVKDAFKTKFPDVKKVTWEKEEESVYEANFKVGHDELSAEFDQDGKWRETETEIKIPALPDAIKQTLAKNFVGYKIKEAAKLEDPVHGKCYEVEITKDIETYDVILNDKGEVLSKEAEKTDKD